MKLWPSDLNCDNMLRSRRGQVLLLLTLTVGVVRGQEWLKEQEPAHRTDYLNTLEIEALGRSHNSDSETRSSSGVNGDQGDFAQLMQQVLILRAIFPCFVDPWQ